MRSFPFPVRVAAGLAATALEQTRHLPGYLIGLPITVTSQVLQLSMQLQQQVTELAIKGDEALAVLREPEEQPGWATFDEDEERTEAQDGADRAGQASQEQATEPEVLSGYDQMSVQQLRGKLRGLSETDLVRLLDHEQAHGQRPQFLRMLSRRLETVRSE